MSKGTFAAVVLAVLQLFAVLFLYNKVEVMERNIAETFSIEQTRPYGEGVAGVAAPTRRSRINAPPREDLMRNMIQEVIREELRTWRSAESASIEVVSASPSDEAEEALQRDLVAQQIEFFSSVGRISELEMHELQFEIAKLDDAQRTEALRQLTRALNSGNIEGRL